jgi:hypothetical protein
MVNSPEPQTFWMLDFLDLVSFDVCLSDSLWEKGLKQFIAAYKNDEFIIHNITQRKKEIFIQIIFESILRDSSKMKKSLNIFFKSF